MAAPMFKVEAIHIRPANDVIAHEWEDCACLPYVEVLEMHDGRRELLVIHNAWDGRD